MIQTLKFIAAHPLTRNQPASAMLRFAAWQVGSRLKREHVHRWIGGSRIWARNGMTGVTGNIYCGLHEFPDMGFLLHMLREDDLFLDIGANISSYTALASAVCGEQSR